MAFSAISWDGTSTNPKPRLRPVFMSDMTAIPEASYYAKTSVSIESSTPHDRLQT